MDTKIDLNNLSFLMKYEDKIDLKTLKSIFEKHLGDDFSSPQIIHITGTNGKGSVSKYISATLTKLTEKVVGRFSSPHIISVRERICVNEKPITTKMFLSIYNGLKNDIEKYRLNYFAIITLIGFIYFLKIKKVNYLVLEVGIGGLHDFTNILNATYAVVTSIGLDHQELLGNTKEKILKEKLGIVKKETKTLFLSEDVYYEYTGLILDKVPNSVEIKLTKVSKNFIETNEILAQSVLSQLLPRFDSHQISEVISKIIWPLRFQNINFMNKKLLLDVAHNEDGIKGLIKNIGLNNWKIDLILFSCLTTKDENAMLTRLKKLKAPILKFRNSNPKSIKAQKLDLIEVINDNPAAKSILITGSCYFLADIASTYFKPDFINWLNLTKDQQ